MLSRQKVHSCGNKLLDNQGAEMLLAQLLVAMLVGAILVWAPGARACGREWFGENCKYRCHCETISACTVNGECDGGNPCARPYFGPSCQYDDMALNPKVTTIPPDFNKANTACRQKTSQSSVSLTFPPDSQRLFWFRITTVNSLEFLLNFSVIINDNDACHNERRFYVSATELDVTCDTIARLRKLELQGRAAQYLCSINVAKGRNVALKQDTWQSSTQIISGKKMFDSSWAVDGDNKSCSRTADNPEGSMWQIMFNRPQLLYGVVIIGYSGNLESDLHRFVLETLNEQNQVMERYQEPGKFTFFYRVEFNQNQPVSSLTIFRKPESGRNMQLWLCEVMVYGETLCPDGYYGLNCDKNCTCKQEDICNLATGACAPGCPAGKYGFECSLDCSKLCVDKCSYRFGKCFQCKPGNRGPKCDEVCTNLTYGLGCRKVCSRNCLDSCDPVTGTCKCVSNFLPPFCNECTPRFYGENCTQPCPRTCQNSICNRSTGYCIDCQGAHIGLHCNECPRNSYGTLCYSKCSTYCINGTCDPYNGTCPSCMEGYFGPKCSIGPPETDMLEGVLFALPIAAILVLFLTCYLLLKKKSGVYDESEDDETSESSFSSTLSPKG